jgi:hypothetical protein
MLNECIFVDVEGIVAWFDNFKKKQETNIKHAQDKFNQLIGDLMGPNYLPETTAREKMLSSIVRS